MRAGPAEAAPEAEEGRTPGARRTLIRLGKRLVRAAAEAVFPFRCAGCGLLFRPPAGNSPARGVTALLAGADPARAFAACMARCLCPECATGYTPVSSPLCPGCGRMYPGWGDADHFCGACLTAPPPFDRARAAGVYDRSLMALIHAFKYRGNLRLARPAGRLLWAAFNRFWDAVDIDLVVPVPLFARRFRQRGFNQAFLLVREWPALFCCQRGAPPPWRIDVRVLLRTRHTRPQAELDRESRRINVRQAFALGGREAAGRISGRRLLLVDDVYTTGSTVAECARVLKRGGAASVEVLTLARALTR